MAAGIVLSIKKGLVGMGMFQFVPELLQNLPRGGPQWLEVVEKTFASKELEVRKVALDQILAKGFLDRSPARGKLVPLLVEVMVNGYGDERRRLLAFVEQNLKLFPVNDDGFRAKVFALQRSGDHDLANAAEQLLPKLGFEQPNRDLFRPS